MGMKYIMNLHSGDSLGSVTRIFFGSARNRWTEENPTSDIPRAGGTISQSDIPSNSELVEDGSHLR